MNKVDRLSVLRRSTTFLACLDIDTLLPAFRIALMKDRPGVGS
jgi:hypothetical protein